jgi:hypothetical protein
LKFTWTISALNGALDTAPSGAEGKKRTAGLFATAKIRGTKLLQLF